MCDSLYPIGYIRSKFTMRQPEEMISWFDAQARDIRRAVKMASELGDDL